MLKKYQNWESFTHKGTIFDSYLNTFIGRPFSFSCWWIGIGFPKIFCHCLFSPVLENTGVRTSSNVYRSTTYSSSSLPPSPHRLSGLLLGSPCLLLPYSHIPCWAEDQLSPELATTFLWLLWPFFLQHSTVFFLKQPNFISFLKQFE